MGTRNRSRAHPHAAAVQKARSKHHAKALIQEMDKRRQEEERIEAMNTRPRPNPERLDNFGTRRAFKPGEQDFDPSPPKPKRFRP
jgi:hypothetical protein